MAYLVGVAEIAEMLGVSRQRVNALVHTHEDFPEPEAELSAGRIWKRRAIEEWAERTGREVVRPEVRASSVRARQKKAR